MKRTILLGVGVAVIGVGGYGLYASRVAHVTPSGVETGSTEDPAGRSGSSSPGEGARARAAAMARVGVPTGNPTVAAGTPEAAAALPPGAADDRDPENQFPKTRFGGEPKDYADATVDEALTVAKTAGTPRERQNAVLFLGEKMNLDHWEDLLGVEMTEKNPKVMKAVAMAEYRVRERFAGKPWPGVVKSDPSKYLEEAPSRGAVPQGHPSPTPSPTPTP